MSKKIFIGIAAAVVLGAISLAAWSRARPKPLVIHRQVLDTVQLPEPRLHSNTSIEEALLKRRSVRSYTGEPLTLAEVSQLLWAAQGITDPRGFRTAPSAGALYPLETYVVVGEVEGLAAGVYHYDPQQHRLQLLSEGDARAELAASALGQAMIGQAAIDIVFSAVYARTTARYGYRGNQYVHMEVGHAGQNVHLQAVALDLGTVVVGAFHDEQVRRIIGMTAEETPLYIMPVGRLPSAP